MIDAPAPMEALLAVELPDGEGWLFEPKWDGFRCLARRSKGPCGTFSVRRRQIPIDSAASGRWVIQIDQRRHYSATPRPVWVRVPVTVRRIVLEP